MGVRRRPDGGRRSDAEELAVYRAFVRQLTETCQAAARGDMEARSRLSAASARAGSRLVEACRPGPRQRSTNRPNL